MKYVYASVFFLLVGCGLATQAAEVVIQQSDFDPSGQTSYVINSPGIYKLAENINYNPVGVGTTAIIIDSSDVILDLQGFTLRQGNVVSSTNGIVVNSNNNDFKIKNGNIENFTNFAVAISNNCSRFELCDLVCVNNGVIGVLLNGSQINPNVSQALIDNVKIIGCLGTDVGAMSLFGCFNVHVTNCAINQNSASNHMSGILVMAGLNLLFENIEIVNNMGAQVFGIELAGGSNITLHNVALVANSATEFLIGFEIVGTNNELYNCRALSNQAINSLIAFESVAKSSKDNLFSTCEASNNAATGIGASVTGFKIGTSGTRTTMLDCIARHNSAPNANAAFPNFGAAGFVVISTTHSLVQGCLAEDQDAGIGSNDVGFFINNASNNIIRDCASYHHDIGFHLEPLDDFSNIFLKNIAAQNTTNYSQFPAGSNQSAADVSAINASLTVSSSNLAIN